MPHAARHRHAPKGAVALALALVLAALVGAPLAAKAEDSPAAEHAIVIVHSNDVHCSGLATSATAIGYPGIAQYASEAKESYGAANVTLVDAGDAIQGQPIGTLSKGQDLVDLMNVSGYDIAVPGNHEFDYGIAQLQALEGTADYPYVSCNVVNTQTGEPLFDGYRILSYEIDGQTYEVAYVGVTTPATLTGSDPSIFEDASGQTIYSFYGDDSGEALYDQVQTTVDAARAEGADYVIAVTHLGKDASSSVPERWTSTAVVAHTTGIDAVIDGHTHQIYNTTVPNEDGAQIPIAQCGTQFQAMGEMYLYPDADPGPDDIQSGIVQASDLHQPAPQDPTVAAAVQAKQDALDQELKQVVGTSQVGLSVYAPNDEGDPWWWAARMHETNLGDYVADAYRSLLDSDVAFVNGGGIRAPQTAVTPLSNGTFGFAAGPFTYNDFISINSFANTLSVVEVKGQDILDALEYSVRALTPAFDDETEAEGSFLQVSGLSFTARVDIPTPVIENSDGGFESVDPSMERRVRDVTVGGAPIDPSATYTMTTIPIILGGDYTMFADATPVKPDVGLDYDALVRYLRDDLGGTIGQAYADPAGQGRITLTTSESPVQETVKVYRLYNPSSGEHLFTTSLVEYQTLSGLGWDEEGTCFEEYASVGTGEQAVYRLYNPSNGGHFFTASAVEADRLIALGWKSEGIAWYGPVAGGIDVFRLYNPNMTADGGLGSHLWTTSKNEESVLEGLGWKGEGIGWRAVEG